MSDYLSEEEQLAQLKAVWQRYGVPLLLVLVLAGGAFVGWRWLESNAAAEAAAASERYDDFLAADGDAREVLLDELLRDYGDTGYAALALLAEAGSAMADGEPDRAAEQLQRALTAAPDPVLKDLVRIRLARVHQQLGDTDAALADLGAVRGAGYRPLALELKGDIHMIRGERDEAHKAYVAAEDALQEGVERPLLAMKVTDTADALRPDDSPGTVPQSDVPTGDDSAAEAADSAVAEPMAEPVPAEDDLAGRDAADAS